MEMKHHFWDRMPYTTYSRAPLKTDAAETKPYLLLHTEILFNFKTK